MRSLRVEVQQWVQQRHPTADIDGYSADSRTDDTEDLATTFSRTEKRKVGGSRPPLTTLLTCGFSI
jgi:hypothetical protein